MLALKNCGLSLKYADIKFKKDKKFVYAAIKNNVKSVNYAD